MQIETFIFFINELKEIAKYLKNDERRRSLAIQDVYVDYTTRLRNLKSGTTLEKSLLKS